MKILVIGFLAFLTWSAFSTYVYVCKIKGLCYESTTVQVDTLRKPAVAQPVALPLPKEITIYFAFDKSELTSDTAVEKYFNESKGYLEQNAQAKVCITGHTDAIGSDEYNQALGYRRGERVQRYFESRGMPSPQIIVESKGEKDPADDNSTTEGRANNRRAVITIKN